MCPGGRVPHTLARGEVGKHDVPGAGLDDLHPLQPATHGDTVSNTERGDETLNTMAPAQHLGLNQGMETLSPTQDNTPPCSTPPNTVTNTWVI